MQPKVFRLDTASPALGAAFRVATASARRRAALVACESAVRRADLHSALVGSAIADLRSGNIPASTRPKLERLAEELDEQYLRLDAKGDVASKAAALPLFAKARAASALAFAVSEDPAELHEAIYEALIAVDGSTDLSQLMNDVLKP